MVHGAKGNQVPAAATTKVKDAEGWFSCYVSQQGATVLVDVMVFGA